MPQDSVMFGKFSSMETDCFKRVDSNSFGSAWEKRRLNRCICFARCMKLFTTKEWLKNSHLKEAGIQVGFKKALEEVAHSRCSQAF
jgi:hypothetical protein